MWYEEGIKDMDLDMLGKLWQVQGMDKEIKAEAARILKGGAGRKVKEHKAKVKKYYNSLYLSESEGKEPLTFFWFELMRLKEGRWGGAYIHPRLPPYFPIYSILQRDTIEEMANHPVDPEEIYRLVGRGIFRMKTDIRFIRISAFRIVGVIELLEDGWYTRNAKKHDGRGECVLQTDQAFKIFYYYAFRFPQKSADFMTDFIHRWLDSQQEQGEQS